MRPSSSRRKDVYRSTATAAALFSRVHRMCGKKNVQNTTLYVQTHTKQNKETQHHFSHQSKCAFRSAAMSSKSYMPLDEQEQL